VVAVVIAPAAVVTASAAVVTAPAAVVTAPAAVVTVVAPTVVTAPAAVVTVVTVVVVTVMTVVVVTVMTMVVMTVVVVTVAGALLASMALVPIVTVVAVVVVMVAAARVAAAGMPRTGGMVSATSVTGGAGLRSRLVRRGVGHREVDHGGAAAPGRPDGPQGADRARPNPDGGRGNSGFGRSAGTGVTAPARQLRRDGGPWKEEHAEHDEQRHRGDDGEPIAPDHRACGSHLRMWGGGLREPAIALHAVAPRVALASHASPTLSGPGRTQCIGDERGIPMP
jgi:hypothetical protein